MSAILRDPIEIAIPEDVTYSSREALATMAGSAAAVSFDFFDTLFLRSLLDPEDVFDLLGKRFSIPAFRNIRKKAQTTAFRRMEEAGRKEISIKDIYDCMPTLKVGRDILEQAEYDIELSLLYPNPDIIWLYLALAKREGTVVITSDMYLPSKFFQDALTAFNLPHVPMYVSCEANATKRDHGELFFILARELNIPAKRILHIGDNPLGDVERAREAGLEVFQYKASNQRKPIHTSCLASSISYGMLNKHANHIEPYSFEELGYLYGGPATVGFLEWVRQQCKQDSIDHLLFVSRDGYAMERVAKIRNGNLPRHAYFLGSRTAFSLAAMNEDNFTEFVPFLLSGSDNLAPAELLERIGVVPPAPQIMEQLGLGPDVRMEPAYHKIFARFLIAYRWEILRVCQRNRHALYRSLLEHGLRSGDRIALVDVGWNGTTQSAFELAVRQMMDLSVYGYYLCLADTPDRHHREYTQRMRAMLDTVDAKNEARILYDNRLIVEQFFSAPHDSVIGLDVSGNQIIPITDAGRGTIFNLNDTAKRIVVGIDSFAQDLGDLQELIKIDLDSYDLVLPLVNLAAEQGGDFRHVLSQIINFDAWGSSRHFQTGLNSQP